jgi:hypothetical protein
MESNKISCSVELGEYCVSKMCEMLDLVVYNVTVVFRWLRRTKTLPLTLLQNQYCSQYVWWFDSGICPVVPSDFSLVWKNVCILCFTTSQPTLVGGTLFENTATHWSTPDRENGKQFCYLELREWNVGGTNWTDINILICILISENKI